MLRVSRRQQKLVLEEIELSAKQESLELILNLAEIENNGGMNHTRVLAV